MRVRSLVERQVVRQWDRKSRPPNLVTDRRIAQVPQTPEAKASSRSRPAVLLILNASHDQLAKHANGAVFAEIGHLARGLNWAGRRFEGASRSLGHRIRTHSLNLQ